MNRPVFRPLVIRLLSSAAAALALAGPAIAAPRPNIILIMTDQQKATATSINGNRFVQTPTWDRLAEQGAVFSQAYAQSTICTPSRASIMTGTYPLVHRVLCHQNHAPQNVRQLAEILSADGYDCIAAGHYESTRELTRGWRQSLDLAGTPALLAALHAVQVCGSQKVGWSAGETKLGPDQSSAAVLNDELFKRLDRIDPAAEPLFLHVAYIEPHPPYFTPRGGLDRSLMARLQLPPQGRMEDQPPWHAAMLANFGSLQATEEDRRRQLAAYYGNIHYVDGQIDRLLRYLDRRGMLENAWVIVTSDHGDYGGEKNFYTKSEAAYECLQHVPLVIRGPGGRWHPGMRVDELVQLIDLFPTILSLAGHAPEAQAQGENLLPWVAAGAAKPLHPAVFMAVGGYEGNLKTTMPSGLPEAGRRRGIVRSARTPEFVYIRDPDTGDEAYDLKQDPFELHDLLLHGSAGPAALRPVVKLLDDWEKECARKFKAMGVIPGDRNFNEPVPITTGDPDWHRPAEEIPTLNNRRELFVDDAWVQSCSGVEFRLGSPYFAGTALKLDRPWEGRFGAYISVVNDGRKFLMYYRGKAGEGKNRDLTCCAESGDGIRWVRPDLGLYRIGPDQHNNVVMPPDDPVWAPGNLSFFYDPRPEVPADERYKAVGGGAGNRPRLKPSGMTRGLYRFVSGDGIHWRRLPGEPLFTGYALDSQNVLTWLPEEKCYAIYLRTWTGDKSGTQFAYDSVRTIARSVSKDFVTWSAPERMTFDQGPLDNLYTNATQPYFRAPQILISMPFRFVPDRQVLDDATLKKYDISPLMWKGVSDAVLMSSRGGTHYQRKFLQSFVRPGLDQGSWAARSNMPGLGVIQTGPAEMSFFIVRGYSSNESRIDRMGMRLDGFASLHADYGEGFAVTKPVRLDGARLSLNLSTSAIGSARVAVEDESGVEIPGFAAADAVELIGDSVDLTAAWKGSRRIGELKGRVVRLKFILRDADLYSFAVLDQ